MNRAIIIAGMGMLLASCGKGEAPKSTERPVLVGKTLDAKNANAKVARMFSVQGRWEGPKDSTPAAKRIVLDIAGTSEFSMDLSGTEGGKVAIFESAQGRYDWNTKGVMTGRISGETGATLSRFSTFEAGFPANDTMIMRSGNQDLELHKSRTPND